MKAAWLLAAALCLAGPLAAQTTTVHVPLRQELVLEAGTGTIAWAVDPTIAEAAIRYGRVTVTGRSAGRTVVSVAGGASVRHYEVIVDPPARVAQGERQGSDRQATSMLEAGHDSSNGRSTAAFDSVSRQGGRVRRVHVEVARTTPAAGTPATTSVPSASVELSSPGGDSLVLLDSFVQHSALTVDGLNVRGLHARRGALRLHAGYASSLLYDDLVLPTDAQGVGGVALALSRGRLTVMPGAFWYVKDSGRNEVLGSLVLRTGRETDAFRMQAELGYGGGWGGASDLAWDAGASHLRVRARHQPRTFSRLDLGPPRGSYGEGSWTASAGRLSVNASGSLARYLLPFGATQRSHAATGTMRLGLGAGFFATAGASGGWFDAGPQRVSAVSLPAGLSYEGRRAGLSALYRYQRNTSTNRGGDGGRVSVRGSLAGVRLSGYVDAQRDAPSVDFILGQEPRLARLLAEQGVTATTPEDVARFLETSAPLLGQGYLEGLRVSLEPWRVQTGADLTWTPHPSHRLQIRAILDRTRRVAGERRTTLATASYQVRVAGAELAAAYTWSRNDVDDWADQGSSFQVVLRKRFDGAPRLPWKRDSIGGIVFGDEEARGSFTPGLPAIAGSRVTLDGTRTTITDARGRFRFQDVPPGAHTLQASLPATDGAFFTTPSSVLVDAGASAGFGISRTPARLVGFVRDDAGKGVPAVSVTLRGASRHERATTGSDGRFTFATADGEYVAAIDPESVPAGYDAGGAAEARVRLSRQEPARLDLVLPAHRALSGRVVADSGAHGFRVRLVEAGRTVETAPDGAYAFRGLQPGRHTLSTTVEGREVRRRVEVPEGPALLNGMDLDPSGGGDEDQ